MHDKQKKSINSNNPEALLKVLVLVSSCGLFVNHMSNLTKIYCSVSFARQYRFILYCVLNKKKFLPCFLGLVLISSPKYLLIMLERVLSTTHFNCYIDRRTVQLCKKNKTLYFYQFHDFRICYSSNALYYKHAAVVTRDRSL